VLCRGVRAALGICLFASVLPAQQDRITAPNRGFLRQHHAAGARHDFRQSEGWEHCRAAVGGDGIHRPGRQRSGVDPANCRALPAAANEHRQLRVEWSGGGRALPAVTACRSLVRLAPHHPVSRARVKPSMAGPAPSLRHASAQSAPAKPEYRAARPRADGFAECHPRASMHAIKTRALLLHFLLHFPEAPKFHSRPGLTA